MQVSDHQQLYSTRAKEFATIAQTLSEKYNRFSLVRLLIFVVGAAIFFFLWSYGWMAAVFVILFLAGFARFVYWHQDIKRAQRHHENLTKVNENELQYFQFKTTEFDGGKTFVDANHPYSVDMDIFDDHSFFQYANRGSSSIGKICFADWLKAPADKPEILARQKAIAELRDQLDWRQNFQALGMAAEDEVEHINALKDWLSNPPFVSNKKGLQAMMYIAPILGIAGIVLWATYLPWTIAILFFLPAGIILKQTLENVNATHAKTAKAGDILAHYGKLIAHIESNEFHSEKLKRLQSVFFIDEKNASKSVQQLSYIITQLNVRYNAFAILLNILTLWDLHWVNKLEKWKAEQQEQLPQWFDALKEFEAVLSFSTLYYNNQDWIFPTIAEDKHLHAVQIGHPLIDRNVRVCNDIEIPTEGHLKLITGSNMAGKSTFLRTVGLNIILAMSGSAVCAKEFSLPILQVYSSMRTVDALHENTSSFYAELKRLKIIIEAVEARDNIFFILDEILKGTNSNDRHTGSKALIQQFIDSQGSGLIATHDLELGGMEGTAEGAIENLCMEVEVDGSELIFDYTIKKGVSQSFNATQLMKQMGIKIK